MKDANVVNFGKGINDVVGTKISFYCIIRTVDINYR